MSQNDNTTWNVKSIRGRRYRMKNCWNLSRNNNNNNNNTTTTTTRRNNGNHNEKETSHHFKHLVVHCRKSKYDVYIGRKSAGAPKDCTNFEWGNPFSVKDYGREGCIEKYEEWLKTQPQLVEKARRELRGKVLGCWCAPKSCHGHVLADVANAEDHQNKTFVFEDGDDVDTSLKERLYFPSSLAKHLIGKKGKTKKRLERETNCKIYLDDKNDVVLVDAPDEQSFESCKTNVELILENAKRSSSFTHFISIPLNSDSMSESMKDWTQSVLKKPHNNLDASVFVLPERFHVTLFMLKLFSRKDIQLVSSILDRVVSKIQHFDLKIGGLEIMNDDPSAAHVVYMKASEVKYEARLHQMLQLLHEHLERAGFVSSEDKEQQRNYLSDGTFSPKIHATVINTKYSRTKARLVLNVQSLLKEEKNCSLGVTQVRGLHLSKMTEFDKDTKYYKSCHFAKLSSTRTTTTHTDSQTSSSKADDDDDDDDRGFWTE